MLHNKSSPHLLGCPRYAAPAGVRIWRVSSTLHNKADRQLFKTAATRPCGVTRAAAASSSVCSATTGTAATSVSANSKIKRSIWTAVDVIALLGSVGGALAALLGVVSPTYALTLPLVLPVVSLIAALQREDLTNEDSRRYLSELSTSWGRDSAALLREAGAAIEEVRREACGQSATAARLSALEDKLAVLEGAVVGAARNSREAAVGVSTLGSALQQTLQHHPAAFAGQAGTLPPQTAQMLAGFIASEVVPMVKAELAGALGPWLAESNAALKRLDTRLAVVEGSLAGLEQAQSEGLMRLSHSLSSSLTDAQATLQSSVRVELATAVEPLKQLPQLVTAAAAKTAQQQQQQAGNLDEQQLAAARAAGGGGPSIDHTLLVPDLREVVAAELSAVTQQLLSQQGDIITTLGQPPRPTPLAEDQWEALGRRLARLERLVQSIPELDEQAVAGQLAPLLTAQQATAEAQETIITSVTSGLGVVTDQLSQGLTRIEGAVQAAAGNGVDTTRIDSLLQHTEAAVQQLGQISHRLTSSATAEGAGANVDNLSLLLQQLTQTMQEQQEQVQLQGSSGAPVPDLSQITDGLYSLQQQVQGLGAALQQVQMDIPAQVGLAVSQAASPAAAAGEASYSGSDAAAAGAASAAAQGISEVRQLLSDVQQVCEGLRMQVETLSNQIAAQQALLNSRTDDQAASSCDALETARQQLASVAADISSDLSQQLRDLCNNLELQLQDLQQQLVTAAAAATSQAVQDAATAAASQQLAAASEQQQLEDVPDMTFGAPEQVVANSNGHAPVTKDSHNYQEQQLLDQLQPPPEQQQYREQAAADGWSPYQQQQSAQQAVQVNGTPASADMPDGAAPGWSSYGPPEPAAWPTGTQQTQQHQTQLGQQVAPVAAVQTAISVKHQQQQQQQQQPLAALQIPDPAALSDEQLRTEGLRLLRAGREATRGTGVYTATGPDFAAAEALLQAAVACFARAVECEPQDTRALGNLGNALLAQGELKKGLLEELRLNATQGGLAPAALQSLEVADARLRSESSTLLTRAGEIFRRVLEVDGWSSRALVNWGKAMVARAELALDPEAATKLYNAAIDKFEAVLEEDPGLVVAKYRCALAMQGLAGLAPSAAGVDGQGSRQQLVLLQDAGRYLSDVASDAGGDEGLRAAAAAALLQVQEQLDMARLARR